MGYHSFLYRAACSGDVERHTENMSGDGADSCMTPLASLSRSGRLRNVLPSSLLEKLRYALLCTMVRGKLKLPVTGCTNSDLSLEIYM